MGAVFSSHPLARIIPTKEGQVSGGQMPVRGTGKFRGRSTHPCCRPEFFIQCRFTESGEIIFHGCNTDSSDVTEELMNEGSVKKDNHK